MSYMQHIMWNMKMGTLSFFSACQSYDLPSLLQSDIANIFWFSGIYLVVTLQTLLTKRSPCDTCLVICATLINKIVTSSLYPQTQMEMVI
jgi:hypothetical protein